MSPLGLILLLVLVIIFGGQTYASGARLKSLALYHWGGVGAALLALWILAAL